MLMLGTLLLLAVTTPSAQKVVDPAEKVVDPTEAAAAPQGGLTRASQCSPIEVTSDREAHRLTVFSASRSLDLGVRTLLRAPGAWASTVVLRVLAPRGFLYQSFAFPPTKADPARRSTRLVTGTLLVAGTAITTNSLYGRWTVEALVDGRPCGRPGAFTLRP